MRFIRFFKRTNLSGSPGMWQIKHVFGSMHTRGDQVTDSPQIYVANKICSRRAMITKFDQVLKSHGFPPIYVAN